MGRHLLRVVSVFGATAVIGCMASGIADPSADVPEDAASPPDGGVSDAVVYRGSGSDGSGSDAADDRAITPIQKLDAGTTTTPDASAPNDSGCAPAATVPTSPAYVPVARQMACSTAQVTAFQNACGSFDWTYPPCVDWFSAPANATCGACVRPTEDAGTNTASGVSIYDMHGKAYPNIAGCDAVIDGNTGCADPFQRAAICDVNACSSSACASASASDFMSCLTAAGYGVCATYTGTFANACQADLAGPLSSSGACSTIAGIVYTICGNGT